MRIPVLFTFIVFLFCSAITVWSQDTTAVDSLSLSAASDTLVAAEATSVDEPAKFSDEAVKSTFGIRSVMRGALGIFSLLLISWLFSANRKAINYKLVLKGLGLQLAIAILVLKVDQVREVIKFISKIFVKVLSFTDEGTKFLFRSFLTGEIESPLISFAVTILPVVVFFSALTSLLFYLGILQKVVYAFAWVMKKTLKLSGAESLAAAGNIFLGQTEAPLLVKPYIKNMTRSELMCLMAGGMATIAGSVFALYVKFLGGDDPEQQLYFATHLLTASVMAAPAAIVAAKILVPETENFSAKMEISKEKIGSNVLDAISNGTSEGLRLAVNVGAMLLVFIALVTMLNFILMKLGLWVGLNPLIADFSGGRFTELSLEFILGYIGAPLSWLMGVPTEDIFLVGQLLGQKTALNELYAYSRLGEFLAMESGGFTHSKSVIMVTYMLCGFANFASIGIQIGGIGALAPEKRAVLSGMGFRALLGGTLASLYNAVIVGMLY
ncbi:MAG: Na+ dependent nucleoside transporter [Flavobacteriales bacterium]|nr:Na+ dependent nucleoside transporter [Flavobacteriales bacterium]